MDLLNLLVTTGINDSSDLCGELAPILKIVGIVVLAIKIAVPIILIVIGMMDLAKAVTEKSEDNIKKAQNLLIKRAIAAAIVFLVASLVGIVMKLIGSDDYKDCLPCINHPFGDTCNSFITDEDDL